MNNSISVVGEEVEASMPASFSSTAERVKQQIRRVLQCVSVMADIVERQSSSPFSNSIDTILSVETIINTAQQTLSAVEEDAADESIEDRLFVLRDQLLQLSPTEQQLNSVPISDQLPVTLEVAVCTTTTTIQTTLQQWEAIFQKIYAEYERLLNKLQDRCDESATAQVWRDHFDQAENYLNRSLPDQYQSSCEDRHLCELHENLLTHHHSVFHSTRSSKDVRGSETTEATEDFNEPELAYSLQRTHQAVLSCIRLRHADLTDRALTWEQYRSALSTLLTWLDAAERDRKHFTLRQIQEHGLPTALHRVDIFMDKIGQGQRVQADFERIAVQLLKKLGHSKNASTIHADLKSAAIRLTNLESGLCTLRDFLQRVAHLYHSLEKGIEGILQQLQSVQVDLVTDNDIPTSSEAVPKLLQHYREQLLMVQTLSSDVEKQEVIAGEIRSCVNLADSKRIWHRLAALHIQRSETEDRLNSLIQSLEDYRDLAKMFEMRYVYFISWASTMEQRLLKKQGVLVDKMIQRLSGPLRDELATKECEQRWLVDQGRRLVCSYQEEREDILSKVANVEEIWRKLMETWNRELRRVRQLPTDLKELNKNLAGLTIWLDQAEATINAPLTISNCSKVAEHRDLENSIEEKKSIAANVSELVNITSDRSALLKSLGFGPVTNASLSDSGIYSSPSEGEALEGAVPSVIDNSAISLSISDVRRTSVAVESPLKVPPSKPFREKTQAKTAATSPFFVEAASFLSLEQQESSGAATAPMDTVSVLQRAYRYFCRMIRTALPYQSVMLLVLGAAFIVPMKNSCMDANSFINSLEIALGYPEGAPPI